MANTKRQWLIRALAGALAGIAAHILLGYALGCFSPIGPASFSGFRFPDCNLYRFFGLGRMWEAAGIALSFALFALLGAEAGIATLPFADSGRELVVRSLIHYAATDPGVCPGVAEPVGGVVSGTVRHPQEAGTGPQERRPDP